MAIRPLNSVAGFSVGETPANIILANGDITTTNITTTGVSNLNSVGNVKISGGSSGQVISTDGAGNLSFITVSTSGLTNGTSNINILNSSNITFSVAGTANVGTFTSTGLNVDGYLTASGNITGGNANLGNAVTANFFIGSGNNLSNIQGANVSGTVANANYSAYAANVTGSAQGNITSVGTLTALDVSATVNAQAFSSNVATGTAPLSVLSTTKVTNLNADFLDGFDSSQSNTANTVAVRDVSGNLTATYFIGDGSQLTGIDTSKISNGNSNVSIPAANGNVNITAAGNTTIVVTGTGANITGYANVSGNVEAGGVKTDNLYYANGTPWDLTQPAGSNTQIQYNDGAGGFGASANFTFNDATNLLTVNGNAQFNNANLGNLATANFVTGTLTTSAQPNITSVGTLSTLNVTGNANVGNLGTAQVLASANVTAPQLISNIADGTAPLVVTSTTRVGNLNVANAGYADDAGNATSATNASAVLNNARSTGTYYPAFISATTNGNYSLNSNTVYSANIANGGFTATTFEGNLVGTSANVTGQLISTATTGTAPLAVSSTTRVANLNVSYANVSDFEVVTSQSTGTFYPVFVNSSSSGNLALGSNSGLSFNAATGNLAASFLYSAGNITANTGLTVTTGGMNVTGNIDVTGNFNVTGNLNYSNVTDLVVGDPLIYLGANNTGDLYDLGFVASYNDGVYEHTGLARNHVTDYWTFFDGVVQEPTTVIDWANATYPTVYAGNFLATGNVTALQLYANANVTTPQFISNVATGTAPLSVQSTTRVANLNVSYANVSDFGVVTSQTTGVYYPTFVSGSTTANYALASNSAISANLANGTLLATTFTGNLSGNVSGNISGTNANLTTANVSGNVLLGNSTVTTTITWASVTTTSTSANQTIASLSATGVTGVEYLVKAIDSTGTKYSVASVIAVTDGSNVDYSTYGTVQLGGYTGSLAVNVVGGDIRLQVTPASSNSTVWTTQYRLI